MSKVKNPQAKKALELTKERRNIYGENSKASRKAIPKYKQLSRKAIRRVVNEALGGLVGEVSPEEGESQEIQAADSSAYKSRKAFKKHPDLPLKLILSLRNSNDEK